MLVIFATITSKTSLSLFVSRYCKISLNFPVKVDDLLLLSLLFIHPMAIVLSYENK